jgi:hypothetical protein
MKVDVGGSYRDAHEADGIRAFASTLAGTHVISSWQRDAQKAHAFGTVPVSALPH